MRLLYVFPEPFPLPRARSVQVSQSISALIATQQLAIDFVSKAEQAASIAASTVFAIDPLADKLHWQTLSARWRGCAWTPQSSRFFHANLGRWLQQHAKHYDYVLLRHLKSVAPLRRFLPHTPLVYEAHEVFARTAAPSRQAALRRLEGQALQLIDGLICNSQATANALAAQYAHAKPTLVLHNGVTSTAGLPSKNWHAPLKIIYAGSFFGWKGIDDLWQALQTITSAQLTDLPKIEIVLVGGEASQLQALAQQLQFVQVSPRAANSGITRVQIAEQEICGELPNGMPVTLLPRQSNAIVQQLLQQAQIAVLPNRPQIESEFTSPIKLFEYMAAGCAVIASDLPAIREVVDESCATFFSAGSADALRRTLLDLLRNLPLAQQLGQQAYTRVQDYTWAARAARQLAFLHKL